MRMVLFAIAFLLAQSAFGLDLNQTLNVRCVQRLHNHLFSIESVGASLLSATLPLPASTHQFEVTRTSRNTGATENIFVDTREYEIVRSPLILDGSNQTLLSLALRPLNFDPQTGELTDYYLDWGVIWLNRETSTVIASAEHTELVKTSKIVGHKASMTLLNPAYTQMQLFGQRPYRANYGSLRSMDKKIELDCEIQ